MLSFCSHDYLCLSDRAEIKKGAIKFLLEYGIALSGECHLLIPSYQQQVAEKLCAFIERESALFYPSHFETFHALFKWLDSKGIHVLADSAADMLSHERYPHLNLSALRKQLGSISRPKAVVAESTFAQTGDQADIAGLIELCHEFEALLIIDDSHSFGLKGSEGLGPCSAYKEIDIVIGSFGKACGAAGSFIACSADFCDQIARVASTAPLIPPPLLGAIDAALDMIPVMEGERQQLQQRSHWLRQQLRQMRFTLSNGQGPLISLIMESREEGEKLQALLEKAQIVVGPVKVIEGEECPYRLNLALTIAHTPDHLAQLVESLSANNALCATRSLTDAPAR